MFFRSSIFHPFHLLCQSFSLRTSRCGRASQHHKHLHRQCGTDGKNFTSKTIPRTKPTATRHPTNLSFDESRGAPPSPLYSWSSSLSLPFSTSCCHGRRRRTARLMPLHTLARETRTHQWPSWVPFVLSTLSSCMVLGPRLSRKENCLGRAGGPKCTRKVATV